jgi:hypothetical protein
VDTFLERIGSVEFGDWLINECEAETSRLDAANIVSYKAAKARLQALEQAKQLLFEFLTCQESMMAVARGETPHGAMEPGWQASGWPNL